MAITQKGCNIQDWRREINNICMFAFKGQGGIKHWAEPVQQNTERLGKKYMDRLWPLNSIGGWVLLPSLEGVFPGFCIK